MDYTNDDGMPDARPARMGVNVAQPERVASAVGGAALALYGLRRRDMGGAALALIGAALVHRGATGHCMVYEAMGLDTAHGSTGLRKQHGRGAVLDASRAIRVEHAVIVNRPAPELFRFWRNFENLPRVMTHLESVEVLSDTRSRWRAKAPAGQHVEWEAVVHNEVPDQLIGWKSINEATVPNAGSVHFRPVGGDATEVRVILEYQPPAGRLGQLVGRLFGEEPAQQVREDLRRFKATMESGAALAKATPDPAIARQAP